MPVTFFWDKEKRSNEVGKEISESQLKMQQDTFNKEEFSNFKVVCADGKEFKVNTYFLRLHSDVFTAFLDNDSNERKTGILELKDLDAHLVEAMLRFCYTGKVENLSEIDEELYMLADRYNIMKLQTLCLNNMYLNLSMTNILKRLERAFAMELPQLKEQAMEYTLLNITQIMDLPQWKKFSKDNPEIVSAILTAICQEKKKKDNQMSWLKPLQNTTRIDGSSVPATVSNQPVLFPNRNLFNPNPPPTNQLHRGCLFGGAPMPNCPSNSINPPFGYNDDSSD